MPKRLNRWRVLAGGLCLSGVLGCEPAPPPTDDLGQIIYDPKEVPGANRKYTLPDRIERKKPEASQGGDADDTATPSSTKPSAIDESPAD